MFSKTKIAVFALLLIIGGIFYGSRASAQNAGPYAGMSGLPSTINVNYINADGGTFFNTIVSAMNDGGTTLLTSQGTQSVKLVSGITNGSTAVGTILDTTNALSTTGAKLVAFRNAGAEKTYMDKDGNIVFGASSMGLAYLGFNSNQPIIFYNGANQIDFSTGAGVRANQYTNPNPGAANTFLSSRSNSANAIGTTINTANTFNSSGQKLLSIQNNAVEKYAIDLNGKPITTFTDTSGTPGSATANTVCGRSAIANGASAATISNSNVTAATVIISQMETSGVGVGNIVIAPGSTQFIATSINALGAATNVTGNLVFSWCIAD